MTPGDLTIACDQTVPFGHDVAVRARRHTRPMADSWVLCVATSRARVRVADMAPRALDAAIDRRGVLRLRFPADVMDVDLHVDSGEIGESEWQFWVDDRITGVADTAQAAPMVTASA